MSKLTKDNVYDVLVIGGGASGMMAAGRAAEQGARVALIEKNDRLGEKLLITGGGRCNLTNAEFDNRKFLANLKKQGDFLFSAFAQHNVKDSIDFFNSRGMPTKIENEGRVFPVSDSARSVWEVLVKYIKDSGVRVLIDTAAQRLITVNGKIAGIETDKGVLTAEKYILATGGVSHPETGSTGEALIWLKALGHTIHKSDVALSPVIIKEKWVHELSGISNQRAGISIYVDGKKTLTKVGRMLFTHFGISGPIVLNTSVNVREALDWSDKVQISLDLMPQYKIETLDLKIQEVFKENQNKKLKNVLRSLAEGSLADAVLTLAGVDGDKEVNVVTREERLKIGKTLKDMRMTPTGLQDVKQSIVASGGVDPREVDFRTMQSRLFSNLYLTGDVIDIERPSGGYSLQICWTTGVVAGIHAGKKKIQLK